MSIGELLPGSAIEVAGPDPDPRQRGCAQVPIMTNPLIHFAVETVIDGNPPSPDEAVGPGLLPGLAVEVARPDSDPHVGGSV